MLFAFQEKTLTSEVAFETMASRWPNMGPHMKALDNAMCVKVNSPQPSPVLAATGYKKEGKEFLIGGPADCSL